MTKIISTIISPSRRARLAALAAAFALIVLAYHRLIFTTLPGLFRDELEDMSFGWYVPLFSLYVVWTERRKIAAALGRPSFAGLAFAVPLAVLGLLGTRGLQIRFEIVAAALLPLAAVWALFGRRAASAVLFPSLFLLFLVPLNTFLDVVTVHLRLLATGSAYAIMKGIGAEVYRSGTMIQGANGFQIDVAAPCSGLRSIFALLALTAGYAYMSLPGWPKRAILFVSAIPIAILGNVTRILTICLVANYASPDFALGFYHDYSGYVVFLVAIALMIALGEAIRGKDKAKDESGGEVAPGQENSTCRSATPLLTILFLATVCAVQCRTAEPTLTEAPQIALGELAGYESAEIGMSEAELNVLPGDTKMLKRIYSAPDGEWFQVSVVIGGRSKSSIHRPELCLPSQGFQMTKPRTVEAAGDSWRFITLEKGNSRPLGFAYTFFNQEGRHTASHTARIITDVFDRSILNRIDRWVMVTINASTADDGKMKAFIGLLKGGMECSN